MGADRFGRPRINAWRGQEEIGAATYVVHLSSRAAFDACRAGRARSLPIYVETRPIYLHLNESRFDGPDGAKYAGAPLRTDADRNGLWAGIKDGSVATVCTTTPRGRSSKSSTPP